MVQGVPGKLFAKAEDPFTGFGCRLESHGDVRRGVRNPDSQRQMMRHGLAGPHLPGQARARAAVRKVPLQPQVRAVGSGSRLDAQRAGRLDDLVDIERALVFLGGEPGPQDLDGLGMSQFEQCASRRVGVRHDQAARRVARQREGPHRKGVRPILQWPDRLRLKSLEIARIARRGTGVAPTRHGSQGHATPHQGNPSR